MLYILKIVAITRAIIPKLHSNPCNYLYKLLQNFFKIECYCVLLQLSIKVGDAFNWKWNIPHIHPEIAWQVITVSNNYRINCVAKSMIVTEPN